jgi:universal stress protein A
MHIKRLLVPYDFSAYAAHALQWALALAERWGAKVMLLHITPVFSGVTYGRGMLLSDLHKAEAAFVVRAEQGLQEVAAAQHRPTVTIETHALMGESVWNEICQAARREEEDLIVMGSHGHSGLAHVLLGSVAEWVVRHAPCPVLVARLPRHGAAQDLDTRPEPESR